MFDCLGLTPESTLIIRCSDEFSPHQVEEYLGSESTLCLPDFLPKRPLILQLIAALAEDDLEIDQQESLNELVFWNEFLNAICHREARIHSTLDWRTIRSVLLEIAQLSRSKAGNVGPLTLTEINAAFERVVKHPPRDEASTMLQRLPTLGRVDAETSDRRFLDLYTLDGLRGTALIEATWSSEWECLLDDIWLNPLAQLGGRLLADSAETGTTASLYLRILRRATVAPNKTLAGDILSGLLSSEVGALNYKGIALTGAYLGLVDLSDPRVKNLSIKDSHIEELVVGPEEAEGLSIESCLIRTLRGVSAREHLPQWISECEIENIVFLTNVARIREAELSREQEIFLTVVQKLFFQRGGGRKEQALLRGLGEGADKKTSRKIIRLLEEGSFIKRIPGNEGTVFVPIRKHTRRLAKILSDLHLSKDSLWNSLVAQENQ